MMLSSSHLHCRQYSTNNAATSSSNNRSNAPPVISQPPLTTQQKLDRILETSQRIFDRESSSAAVLFLEKQYRNFPHIRILERQAHYLIAKAQALKMAPFVEEYQENLRRVDLQALPSENEYKDKDAQEMAAKLRIMSEKALKKENLLGDNGASQQQKHLESNNAHRQLEGKQGGESNSKANTQSASSSEDPYERPPTVEFEKVQQHVNEEDIADQRPEQIMEEAIFILNKVIDTLEGKNKMTKKRELRLKQLLAECVHELGDFHRAEKLIKDLVKKYSEDVRPYESLGYLYMREAFRLEDSMREQGTIDDSVLYKRNNLFLHAIQFFTHGLHYHPNHVRSLTGRARCFQCLKQYDAAIKDYTAVLGEVPDHWTTYHLRGTCYFETEKWSQANSDLQYLLRNFEEWSHSHMKELHYANPEAALQKLLFQLAIVNKNLGELYEPGIATAYLDYITAANRTSNEEDRYLTASALALRSQIFFEQGNYQKCIDDSTRAINLDRRALEAFKWRAQAYEKTGQRQLSKEDHYNFQYLLGKGGK